MTNDTPPAARDYAPAHALARLGLGINIALHGWTRLPRFDAFQTSLREQFAASLLPDTLVQVTAYVIVGAESVVGLLLLLGFWLRGALIAGSLLMCTLLFGVCLVQNWSTAGTQMIYLAFFTALLATARHDRYSLDYWRVLQKQD